MDRKDFLLGAGGLLTLTSWGEAEGEETGMLVRPPYLKPGDCIGITSPAGFMTQPELEPAIQLIKSWGYTVKTGNTIGRRDNTFGGTDAERAADFQQMLDDRHIKAILCARGGYGSVRIVDRLKWDQFKLHPKWIIGFSDITVLHAHLNRQLQVASLHSKMCNSFPDNWSQADTVQAATILSIRNALRGDVMSYDAPANLRNRVGVATGPLVGGNLKCLESIAGSRSELNTAGKILFVEDTGEYLYSIDRMFWNLQRSGKLDKLAGLIIGGFRVKADDPGEEFGRTLEDIVLDRVKPFKYPVCFDFPVGHQKNNFALKCGFRHRLTVNAGGTTLIQTV
ncbi:MAG: LD-carboxypeptidase [Chitinophagaceae bacterium]